ncbi:MAG: hypothetical protein ABIT83_14460 [Massilia sp.]
MRRGAALLLAAAGLLSSGCATREPAPAAVVSEARLQQTVLPGQTTRAQLLAALGDGPAIRFDSGAEVRLFHVPESVGAYREFVVLLDPNGIVAKTRKGALVTPPR